MPLVQENATEEDEEGFTYKNISSSASFDISDLQGFVFGPNASRFWMYRKHINSMDIGKL